MPSIRGEAGIGADVQECSWFSTYRIHHRARRRVFATGRCFVLGDAAHIHSPVGAQGMNTGLQDAYNLGWKLALVVQGKADAALLDSYDAERMPVAQRLLADDRPRDSSSSSRTVRSRDSCARRSSRASPRFAMRRRRVQRAAFRIVSQTGIHYRGRPALGRRCCPTTRRRRAIAFHG